MVEALKPLKPRIFDIRITGPTMEKEKHWKKTFHSYVSAYDAVGEVNMLDVLTNFLSYTV